MEKKINKLKIGDVYNFNWNTEEYNKQSWGGSLSHCFEGLLVVMEYPEWNEEKDKYENELKLVDTFWGVNRTSDNKSFTLEEAQKRGVLTFYCNLNDIEGIEKYNLDKYDDKDLFALHDQHSCVESCIHWYKKKGAKQSPAKRISVIDEEIIKAKKDIEYNIRQIENLSGERKKLEISGF